MNFVDLDRSFVPLRKDQEPSLDIGRFWGARLNGWLNWEELRRRRRVVLLAEAASGKTEEFRHQCEVLKAANSPAFFLRIEELVDHGIEAALDRDSTKSFETWLAGSSEAWFFLDSVDEARLNRKNFDTALRRFAKDMGTGLERAHIYVSCRVTDWRGADDRTTFTRYLPAWKKPIISPVTNPDDYSALLDPIFKKKPPRHLAYAKEKEDELDEFLVVQLVPLSPEQYRSLASEVGVSDVDRFVAAIAKQGFEAFTERPGDLIDLADYWNSHGKFGSFVEMLEHSITRKLAERDPHRLDNELISPEGAREGVERLAGALTFGKSFTLRAPGHNPDPSLAAGALAPSEILPDWSDAQRNALLRRGIFAPATYGRVRFHHRWAQDYLTARWLDRLLRNNSSRTEIFQLLFAERYGVETIVPSLRPAAAWLSLWHPDILSEVIRREPLTLIAYGDPGSIAISVREQLLVSFASKQAKAELSDERLEPRALWMFADKRLASAIKKAWKINSRSDFRLDLLRLIREGGIEDAASLAKPIALDAKADETHRIVALQAAGTCADIKTLTTAAVTLVKKPEAASARLAPAFSLVLYPQYLSTQDLLKVINKSQRPSRHTVEGFGYQLRQFYNKAPDNAARESLLGGLANLCLSKPFTDDYHRIGKRFEGIAKQLHDLTRLEVLRLGNNNPPSYLARLLMVVERAGRDDIIKEEMPKLYELVRNNAKLNRALFWADIAEERENGRHGPVLDHWQVYHGGNARLWDFSAADLNWLYGDLTSNSNVEDKQVTLSAILTILHREGRLQLDEAHLRGVIGSEPVLLGRLNATLTPPAEDPSTRALRLKHETYVLKAEEQEVRDKESWIAFRKTLLENPVLLSASSNVKSSRSRISRLQSLSIWLHKRTGSDIPQAATEWRLLEEGFSRAVAEAYRDGMKLVWRQAKAIRPIRTSNTISTEAISILAFAGIGIEAAENSDWTIPLLEKEASLAAHHGCRVEQNYPEWLNQLALAWPEAVLPAIKEEVEREWTATSDGLLIFLFRYGAPAYSIPQPVQGLILSAILKSDANSVVVLRTALRVVRNLKLDAGQHAKLFAIAKARYATHIKAKKNDFALSYLALLLMLDPDTGLGTLRKWLNSGPKAARKERVEKTFSTLFDRHDPIISSSFAPASTKTLEALLHLAYSLIRPKDDAVHHGSYSPDARDHAESARNAILSALLDRPGADAYQAMKRLAEDPVFALRSHRFRELAREKAERDTERPAWSPAEALTYHRQGTAPAKTGAELLRVVVGMLSDIAQHLAHGDATSRPLLERADNEDEVQQWLAEQMNGRAQGRFHAVREPQVAGGDKPDVIVTSTSAPCQVAIEVKHGGKGWTARDLEGALRTQLAENYLKPENRRHGVLVVTHHRNRRWRNVSDKKNISFSEVIAWLSGIANTLTENKLGPITVRCVGINAWKDDGYKVSRKQTKHAKWPIKKRRSVR